MRNKAVSFILLIGPLLVFSPVAFGLELAVPFFSQRDPQWAGDYMGSSGCTIEDCGCVMVDTAMLLKFYGVDTDPGILNTWLSNNNGYTSGGELYWNKPAEYSNGKMQYMASLSWTSPPPYADNDHWDDLKNQLDQGYPVIVKVDAYLSTPELEAHWVLVTSFAGGDIDEPYNYYINDPWDISFDPDKRLSYYYDSVYDNTFFAIRVYHGTAATVPEPPTLLSPGTETEPGPEIDTLTPTFRWSSGANATDYGLYIRNLDTDVLVFNSEEDYGTITGTQFTLPSNHALEYETQYRWNMASHNSLGWSYDLGTGFSERLYFTTIAFDAPPTVDTFSVTPTSVTLDDPFTISYSVSDDIGLQQTELWRANDVGGTPDWDGTDNPIITTPLSGQTSYSGSFIDALSLTGTYWYGMHVVDTSGQWSFEPDPPGPIQVTVTVETTPPAPPTHISPADGSTLSTLTPTFTWSSVPNADGYGLYISEPPYGEAHLVFDSDAYYGGPISGTPLELPAGILSYGVTYHWNMNSYNSAGWGSCSSAWSFTPTETIPRVEGIDVSSIQGYIDWSEVYNADYRFAFARASWGDENPPTYIDDYFETNMQNGHSAGVLMGAYHFAYPEYTDPTSEAQHFLNVAGDYLIGGYLRPVLDLEDDPSFDSYPYRLGTEALSSWVHEWMNTVKDETGIEPILYTNSNYANNYLNTSVTQYNLWIAHWTYNPNTPPNAGIWDDWDFWQYSDQGAVLGINGNVDLDLFNGDMSSLSDFVISVGSTGWKSPTAHGRVNDEWVNPSNAYSEDGLYAVDDTRYEAGGIHQQDYYNFNFDIPENSIIKGIEIKLKCYVTFYSGSSRKWLVYLYPGGISKFSDDFGSSVTTVYLGGSSDTWGETWSPDDFSNDDFRVRIEGNLYNAIYYLDSIQVKIYYTVIEGDINGDGKVDFYDFAILGLAWLSNAGDSNWNPACDISTPKDNVVDERDLAVLCENWLAGT